MILECLSPVTIANHLRPTPATILYTRHSSQLLSLESRPLYLYQARLTAARLMPIQIEICIDPKIVTEITAITSQISVQLPPTVI